MQGGPEVSGPGRAAIRDVEVATVEACVEVAKSIDHGVDRLASGDTGFTSTVRAEVAVFPHVSVATWSMARARGAPIAGV
jgi:hypothetical protein